MSGNPYQNDRGNKDLSIGNAKGQGTLTPSPGTKSPRATPS